MAKARTRKTDAIAAASDHSFKQTSQLPAVSADDVARRAYDLYLARGSEHGHDVDDWLQAERELHARAGRSPWVEFH